MCQLQPLQLRGTQTANVAHHKWSRHFRDSCHSEHGQKDAFATSLTVLAEAKLRVVEGWGGEGVGGIQRYDSIALKWAINKAFRLHLHNNIYSRRTDLKCFLLVFFPVSRCPYHERLPPGEQFLTVSIFREIKHRRYSFRGNIHVYMAIVSMACDSADRKVLMS